MRFSTYRKVAATGTCLTLGLVLCSLSMSAPPQGKGGKGKDDAQYVITDLGSRMLVYDISEPGGDGAVYVTGYNRSGSARATIWEVNAAGSVLNTTVLGVLPNRSYSHGFAVNSKGFVVGASGVRAFLARPGTAMEELKHFVVDPNDETKGTAAALDINEKGEIIGASLFDASGVEHGAYWYIDASGAVIGPRDLGNFFPRAINDSGVMTGATDNGQPAIASFDSSGNLAITQISPPPGNYTGHGWHINNSNEVAGEFVEHLSGGGVIGHAFYWSATSGTVLLGTFGGLYGDARGINDAGHVVGFAHRASTARAFIWRNGQKEDLNDLANASKDNWLLGVGTSINNRGQIIGHGDLGPKRSRVEHAFLLTPK